MKKTTMGRQTDARTAVAAALLLAYGGQAQALEFAGEDGWQGSFNTTLSVGASWRAEAPDPALYSQGDGSRAGYGANGTGGTNTDSGNLNWDKGDRFSTPFKAVFDFSVRKDTLGMFVRAKTWYDQALEDRKVRAGNGDTDHAAGQKLSDASQPRLNKFKGAALLDAYVYDTFDAGGHALQIRGGRQVVNWGESLFIQGVNQLNPVDLPALQKPGTEVKEALLPVLSLLGNLSLGDGASLEAFYQFKWEPHNIDQCGLYWSPIEWSLSTSASSTGCKRFTTTLGPDNASSVGLGSYVNLDQGKDGKDSGQWGLALRFPAAVIDSEIGLYALRINSRAPIVSTRLGTWGPVFGPLGPAGRIAAIPGNPAAAGFMSPVGGFGDNPALAAAGVINAKGFWEYPDKIEIYGLSLATNLAGWSVGGELSHTPHQPVQINGNDLLYGVLAGVGPLGAAGQAAAANGAGTVLHGYDRMAKTQLQVNTIKMLPSLLGAAQGLLIAEVAGQRTDLPDNGRRYGRGFIFGAASDPTYAPLGLPGGNTCGTPINPQADGCLNDGFVTGFAWGYRLKASLDYPGLVAGFNFTPSVFWGHDVSGFSSDSQFVEDRQVLTLGMRFDYQKKYVLDFGYTTFGNQAKYDMFRDRDYYNASFSMTF